MIKFLLPALLLFSSVKGQTIIENKKDEFTGSQIKRTSWETMLQWYKCVFVQGIKIDDKVAIGFRFTDCSVIAIEEGKSIMFKMSNDSILKFNVPYTLSCRGCGGGGSFTECQGVEVNLKPNDTELEILKTTEIVKVRIYSTKGYIDCDIPEKNRRKLKAALAILN